MADPGARELSGALEGLQVRRSAAVFCAGAARFTCLSTPCSWRLFVLPRGCALNAPHCTALQVSGRADFPSGSPAMDTAAAQGTACALPSLPLEVLEAICAPLSLRDRWVVNGQ